MTNLDKMVIHEEECDIQAYEISVIQRIMESKAKYRKVVQAAIARWVSDFQKGNIEIKTVDDLRKLIEMDIELQKDEL